MSGPNTLMAYAEQLYPGCATDLWKGEDPPLAEHTVVMQVVGQRATESAISVLEHEVGEDRVVAVLVRTDSGTQQQRHRIDREEMASIAIGASVGAGLGILAALIVLPGVWTSIAIALLAGGFGAGLAALVTMREQVAHRTYDTTPTPDVGFVAALLDDGDVAYELAATLEEEGLYDVQVVHPG